MAEEKKGYQTTTSEYHGEFGATVNRKIKDMPTITVQGLKDRMGRVNILDVRTGSELQSSGSKIPGAVSANPENPDWMDRLSRDHSYVVYSQTEQGAANVVLRMINKGFRQVHVLEGGLEGWSKADQPVEPGPRESGETKIPASWIKR